MEDKKMNDRFVAKYIGKGYVVKRIKNGKCVEEQFIEFAPWGEQKVNFMVK